MQRASANCCGLPSDTVTMVTVDVPDTASDDSLTVSVTAATRDCCGPTPNARRGKMRAMTESIAVCFWTLTGAMAGPVTCAVEERHVLQAYAHKIMFWAHTRRRPCYRQPLSAKHVHVDPLTSANLCNRAVLMV